jgi:hypothetical protein
MAINIFFLNMADLSLFSKKMQLSICNINYTEELKSLYDLSNTIIYIYINHNIPVYNNLSKSRIINKDI